MKTSIKQRKQLHLHVGKSRVNRDLFRNILGPLKESSQNYLS